jgi:hypothetical protein
MTKFQVWAGLWFYPEVGGKNRVLGSLMSLAEFISFSWFPVGPNHLQASSGWLGPHTWNPRLICRPLTISRNTSGPLGYSRVIALFYNQLMTTLIHQQSLCCKPIAIKLTAGVKITGRQRSAYLSPLSSLQDSHPTHIQNMSTSSQGSHQFYSIMLSRFHLPPMSPKVPTLIII